MTPWEVEAKLTPGRAEDARSIATLRKLGRYRLRVLPAQRLRTIYLDTPTFSLARRGVALRVRRDGSAWEATAKWGGQVDDAVHQRAELTVPLAAPPRFPFALPPGPLATQLTALAAGAKVSPIFVTEIARQRRAVVNDENDASPLAELDIDCVILSRPRQHQAEAPYWEVEIELRDGDQRDVVQLARLLRRQYALTPSADSKFTRGLRLFHPRVVPTGEPAAITATDTVATAAHKIVGRHLARVQYHDPATRAGNDPEAVHDMRVAIRRLRAAVRAFKPGFPKPLRRTLKDELAWLAQVLGDVRDIDVQLVHLSKQKQARRGVTLEPLRRHLLAQRKRRRAPLKAALNAPRYTQLLAALDAFAITAVERDDSVKPVARRGRRALRKSLRRLMRDGRRAMADPTPEPLHALRISAKRVRYLLEFLKEMTGRPGLRLTKALVELQDTLGMQHDAVVAMNATHEVLRTLESSANRSSMRPLRAFIDTQQRAADRYGRRAQALWKRFSRPSMTKDVHAVLDHLARAAAQQEA